MNPDRLAAMLGGYAFPRNVIVVTERGVEIPIGNAQGWTVVEFMRTLAEIDALPETQEPS